MRRLIIRWVVIAVAVPIVASILRQSGDKVAQQRGPNSKAAKGLRMAGNAVRFVK